MINDGGFKGGGGYAYVRERLGIVSVKDFGAAGNGVTDDTAAIQAAIDYLGSIGGGKCVFPGGTYVISESITISYSDIALEGATTFNPTIQPNGSFDAIVLSGGISGTRIANLAISPSVTQTSGAGISADSTGNAVYTTLIENVYFATYDGIRLYNTNTTSILHCRMNCSHYGLYCGSGCTIVRFTNAEVGGGTAGVFLDGGCASIKMEQLEIFTSQYGVAIDTVNGGSAPSYIYMYEVECNLAGTQSSNAIFFYINDAGEVHLTECWCDGGPQAIQINSGTVTILGGRFGDGNSPIIGIAGGNSTTIVGSSIAGSPGTSTGIAITGGGNIRIQDCIFGLFGDALTYAVTVSSAYTGVYGVSAGSVNGNLLIAGCSMGHTVYQKGNGYDIQCAAGLVTIVDTFGANPYGAITPPASPFVSGTVYQNTTPVPITIYQPAYASTSGTAGSVAVALGSTSTPSTLYTDLVDAGTTSTSPRVLPALRVPPGWYYSFTATGATLADAMIQGE